MSAPLHAVILGGGIMGLSAAYYIATDPTLPPHSTVVLVEPASVAHAASGRAMGMIGRDWQPAHTMPLSNLSWRCYEELADRFDGKRWDWASTSADGVRLEPRAKFSFMRDLPTGSKKQDQEGYVREFNGTEYTMDSEGVGVVTPDKLCKAIHDHLTAIGVKTITGSATSLDRDARTIHISSSDHSPDPATTLPYTHVLLAAGPWTDHVATTLSLPTVGIRNLPGHSIHVKPSSPFPKDIEGKSIFVGVTGQTPEDVVDEVATKLDNIPAGEISEHIELIVRPDGYVYIAGENGVPRATLPPSQQAQSLSNNLTVEPSAVSELLDDRLVKKLVNASALISDKLDIKQGAELVLSQLCYRPTTADGSPFIGWLDQSAGVLIAAGHGPWGITLGPGTGRVIADLVLSREPSVSLAPFEPHRLRG